MSTSAGTAFKVWNCDKSQGFLIPAIKFELLVNKVKEKFAIHVETAIRFVLKDGIGVDEDSFEFLQLDINTELFVLKHGECLNFPSTSSTSEEANAIHASGNRLIDIVNEVRNKRKRKSEPTSTNTADEWELPDILDMSTTSENIDLEDLSVDSSTDLVPRTDVVPLSDENNSVIVVENSEESSDVVPLSDENNSVIVVDNSEEGSDNSQTEDNQVPEDNTDLNSTAVYERQNSHDSSAGGSSLISPVTVRLPSVPQCMICSDRYSECFLDCGHILCYICAAELEERGSICHICRNKFNKVCRLFF